MNRRVLKGISKVVIIVGSFLTLAGLALYSDDAPTSPNRSSTSSATPERTYRTEPVRLLLRGDGVLSDEFNIDLFGPGSSVAFEGPPGAVVHWEDGTVGLITQRYRKGGRVRFSGPAGEYVTLRLRDQNVPAPSNPLPEPGIAIVQTDRFPARFRHESCMVDRQEQLLTCDFTVTNLSAEEVMLQIPIPRRPTEPAITATDTFGRQFRMLRATLGAIRSEDARGGEMTILLPASIPVRAQAVFGPVASDIDTVSNIQVPFFAYSGFIRGEYTANLQNLSVIPAPERSTESAQAVAANNSIVAGAPTVAASPPPPPPPAGSNPVPDAPVDLPEPGVDEIQGVLRFQYQSCAFNDDMLFVCAYTVTNLSDAEADLRIYTPEPGTTRRDPILLTDPFGRQFWAIGGGIGALRWEDAGSNDTLSFTIPPGVPTRGTAIFEGVSSDIEVVANIRIPFYGRSILDGINSSAANLRNLAVTPPE